MYESGPDPYCYPGTNVLRNRLGLRDQAQLDDFEALVTAQRSEEPLPGGRLGHAHYRAIHKHLFQDVFAWAGEVRTVRISKGLSVFCYPEHIAGEMQKLFERLRAAKFLKGLSVEEFARQSAHVLAELNAIHPFREGNGRTQLVYLTLLADRAGHPLMLERMDPKSMFAATIVSFDGDETPLATLIESLIDASVPRHPASGS
jgi:cell filamentation protein, protein adenylyltransferase